jgi:hypothetical protein
MQTDPPFTTPRPLDDRQALLRQRPPLKGSRDILGLGPDMGGVARTVLTRDRRAGTGSRGRRPGHAGRFRLAAMAEIMTMMLV